MKSIQDASDVTSEYTERYIDMDLNTMKVKEKIKGNKAPENKTVDQNDKK